MDSLTSHKLRGLTPNQLGLSLPETAPSNTTTVAPAEERTLPEDDPILVDVKAALQMGFAGVILSGPPGTGKTVYSQRLAKTLTTDSEAIRTIQFHTSYQYEDFMEGYAPTADGSFAIEQKIFPALCGEAAERPDVTHILIIDEISRSDVARVFGEALTYIERDKRGQPFTLASGSTLAVPENLIIIGTMNPWDKGVDELDVALERRFAQIDMLPNAETLRAALIDKGAQPSFADRIVSFFNAVQALDDEMCHLGHAYLYNCIDATSSRRAWGFRLFPFFKRACRLDQDTLNSIVQRWQTAISEPPSLPTEPSAPTVSG